MKNFFKKSLLTVATAVACIPMAIGLAACNPAEEEAPGPSDVLDKGTYVIHKLTIESGGETMGMRLNLPKEYEGKLPVMIMCVGAEQLMESLADFATTYAQKGYATVQFDYTCTEYNKTTSTGEEINKSISSMCGNIDDILAYLAADEEERFDMDRVALCGYSLGGLVSSVYASQNPDKIQEIFIYAPAFDMYYRAHGGVLNDDGTPSDIPPEWGDPYAEDAPEYVETEGVYTGVMSNKYIKECWDLDYSKIFDTEEGYSGKIMYCVGTADSARFYGQIVFENYMANEGDMIYNDETQSVRGTIYKTDIEFTRDNIDIFVIGSATHNMIKEHTSVLLEVLDRYLEANPF